MAGQSADEDDRKLFVGGLPQEVSEEELNEHFGQFGEIESVNLKTDPNTGRSRGFCFVVYKGVDGLEKAVATEEAWCGNKFVLPWQRIPPVSTPQLDEAPQGHQRQLHQHVPERRGTARKHSRR